MKRLFIILPLLISFSSCNKFLDELPDQRTEVNNSEKITRLLVSAYPESSPMLMAEISSDNVMDNGGQFDASVFQEELYQWKACTGSDVDGPNGLWSSCYAAINAANMALESIADLGNTADLNPQKGEALICRAYAHFLLANIFCMQYNPETADSYMGIPYITKVSENIHIKADRGTLKQTFEAIEQDIIAGLPLINDALYSVPKYHFNVKAANAFAARFYLYYQKWDKVIEHANAVLGTQPEVSLRKWEEDFGNVSMVNDVVNTFISDKKTTNLLIVPTMSSHAYYLGPYGIYERYGHGQDIYLNETLSKSGPWSDRGGLVMSNIVISNPQKNCFPKFTIFFEYIDKTSGIGYNHVVTVPFTADETLLCRAEAYILGEHNYDKALADINKWIKYHSYITKDRGSDLTVADVNKYYNSVLYNPIVVSNPKERSVKKTLNPQGFTVAKGTEENLIQLVLHLRRLESLQEGLRWFDLKRYGIEFSHNIAGELPEILLKDDDRRAIQIPQDVISAGIPANPRAN